MMFQKKNKREFAVAAGLWPLLLRAFGKASDTPKIETKNPFCIGSNDSTLQDGGMVMENMTLGSMLASMKRAARNRRDHECVPVPPTTYTYD